MVSRRPTVCFPAAALAFPAGAAPLRSFALKKQNPPSNGQDKYAFCWMAISKHLAVCVCLLAGCALAQIPLTVEKGAVFIDVIVNHTRVHLLLDTGATITSVRGDVLSSVGLEKVTLHTAAGAMLVHATLANIKVGQNSYQEAVLVLDPKVSGDMRRAGYDGLLGLGTLRNMCPHEFAVRFASKELTCK